MKEIIIDGNAHLDMRSMEEIIKEVLSRQKRNKITFLTGAGISAESGIPTYRGTDGIWVKGTKYHKPEEFGTKAYFLKNQEEVWQYTLFTLKLMTNAKPNLTHDTLVAIEQILAERFQLITQNIDQLHQRAGSSNIYEIHGNLRELKCSENCREIISMPKTIGLKDLSESLTEAEIAALVCTNCGAWLRPNVLWFDEDYDEKTNKRVSALRAAKNTGLLFVIGSSGATNLPIEIVRTALAYGAYVFDVNIEDNEFTNLIKGKKRAIVIRERSSKILPVIKEFIEKHV